MILDKNCSFETFESCWPKLEKAILGYSTGTKNKTQRLCNALKDLVSSDSDSEDDEEHTSNGKVMHVHMLVCIWHHV